MSVDFFLVDCPHTCPEVWAVYEASLRGRNAIWRHAVRLDGLDELGGMVDRASKAAVDAHALVEQWARAAWSRAI
jgi:hypothetical protein